MKHYQCGDPYQDIQDLRRDLAASLRLGRMAVRVFRSIAERADSNAQDMDENSDEHSGFICIRDEAYGAIWDLTQAEAR
jgi:hypothetical protein